MFNLRELDPLDRLEFVTRNTEFMEQHPELQDHANHAQEYIDYTSAHGHFDILNALKEAGIEETINLSENEQRVHMVFEGALRYSCEEGSPLRLIKALASGTSVHAVDADGDTPLLIAAAHGNADVVRILLAVGANSKHANYQGYTAIGLARGQGFLDVVAILESAEKNEAVVNNANDSASEDLKNALWRTAACVFKLMELDSTGIYTEEERTALKKSSPAALCALRDSGFIDTDDGYFLERELIIKSDILKNVPLKKLKTAAWTYCGIAWTLANGYDARIGDTLFEARLYLTEFCMRDGFDVVDALNEMHDKIYELGQMLDVATCASITNVIIPKGVAEIDARAFDGYISLASINVPEGVTSIGEWAFDGCASLANITIPESVTMIGVCAFMDCVSLTSINIPESVTEIGWGTFCGCSSLTSITIPENVTEINEFVFCECSSLADIIILGNVTMIGKQAFWGCSGITEITIPESVTMIGEEAFYGCWGLVNVAIPHATQIYPGAFDECPNLVITRY
jgi:hypothetical protein